MPSTQPGLAAIEAMPRTNKSPRVRAPVADSIHGKILTEHLLLTLWQFQSVAAWSR